MTTTESLTLTFYGHCAFVWQTAAGVRVLTDPYRNIQGRYWFYRQFPRVESDLALVTHAHFDHDAVTALPEETSVIRMPGEFTYRDVAIRGIRDIHSANSGRRGMVNTMFRIETGGLRFLHIGDNRATWPENVRAEVGDIDVLFVTVDDSCHLLRYAEVDQLIATVQPRIIVPMHYLIPGLMPCSSTLLPADGWLATQKHVRRLGQEHITLSVEDLPAQPEVWVFEAAIASLTAPRTAPVEG